jgi:pimeloyl-ACP methyl ester carboxylesterase
MFIATNGIRVNVKEQGSGTPAIVFLHYYGGSSRTWDEVIAALPTKYHTVAPDHRGWGESEAPVSGYNLKDFADDAAGVIEALDLKEYILVGHSMGGKIAQLLASRQPAGLVGLALVAPGQPTSLEVSDEMLAQMLGAYLTRESVNSAIDHALTARPLSTYLREQVIEDSLRGAPQAREAWPMYTCREDISKDVASISVPTIVIAGELDRVDNLETHKSQLLPYIRHARLHVIPATGHLSPLESPVEVAALIYEFALGLLHSATAASGTTAA